MNFFLKSFVFIGLLLGGSIQSFAQTADNELAGRLPRGPDRACLQCHKNENQMLGKHSGAVNPNNNNPVTCTNCHGNTTPEHRDGVRDVMVFKPESDFPLDQRNGVCMSCHEVADMRKVLWAHDVHITTTFCTNCHQVHPAKEPMRDISPKDRIKLCVDCHGKLHEEKKAAGQGGS